MQRLNSTFTRVLVLAVAAVGAAAPVATALAGVPGNVN